MNSEEFYKNLPKKRIATGILIPHQGKYVAVKPSYKSHWTIPGGIVEENESPLECAIREVKEEIGISVKIIKILGVDWKQSEEAYRGDCLHFTFLSAELSNTNVGRIQVDGKEITEFQLVSPERLIEIIDPPLMKRVGSIFRQNEFTKTLYMHGGDLVI